MEFMKDSVVIVTGGGTGIGKATAILFAKNGAKVVVCGKRIEPLEQTVEIIRLNGGEAHAISVDVSIHHQVEDLISLTMNLYGKIDILVNSAGIPFGKPIIETTEEEWDKVLDVNLKGVFLCCKAVLPRMKDDSVIITISSMMGLSGGNNAGAYSASKFGITGLIQSLICEHKGIRAYVVCPGTVVSDMNLTNIGMQPEYVADYIVKLSKSNKDVDGSPIMFDSNFKNLLWFGCPLKLKFKIRKLYHWLMNIMEFVFNPMVLRK